MKLRQKLAVVLAASMVVTAVPVVTMAATTNSINCDIKVRDGSKLGYYESKLTTVASSNSINCDIKVRDGSKLGFYKTDVVANPGKKQTTVSALTINNQDESRYEDRSIPNLEIFPKDDYLSTNETFFIYLEDGELDFAAYLAASLNKATFEKISELGGKLGVYEEGGIAYKYNKDDIKKDAADKLIMPLGDEIKFDGVDGKNAEDLIKYKPVLTYKNEIGGKAKFTLNSNKEIKVEVSGDWNTADRNHDGTPLLIPLFVNAKSTQVKVKIDGSESFATNETKTIGVANEEGKELTITADDAKKPIPYDGGEISKLILTEEVLSAIQDSNNGQIKLELPSSSDLEWKTSGIVANGKRGFSGQAKNKKGETVKTVDVAVEAQYGKTGRDKDRDKQVLIIQLPDWNDNNARGIIELTGIQVEPTDDTAKTGELSITVSAVNDDDFTKEKSLTVGVVKEYDVELTCEKPASIKAGRSGIVNKYSAEAVLAESVKDSLVTGRDVKFTLENGYIIGPADILSWTSKESYNFGTVTSTKLTTDEKVNKLIELLEDYKNYESTTADYDKVVASSPKSSRYKKAALAAIRYLVEEETIKFSDDAEVINKNPDAITDVEVNTKGQVVGFTLDGDLLESGKDDDKRLDDGQRDDLKVKLPVATSLQSTGEVTLVASGRALAELGQEDKVSCKIADIVAPIKVDMTAANLKVGLQEQSAGSIVINETDKGMIEKGTIIVDANPQEEYGIKFQNVPKVEATNLKLGDVALSSDKRYLYIEVEKTSTEAGKISITDATFTTDRTVPEGTFPVRFYGDALTDEDIKTYDEVLWDKYVVDDFIKITTPNTEDIKNGALKAVTSSFTLDSAKYTVDGVEYQMDAPAYSKDGRTMVPVRYLAYAFGLNTENVTFANGTATIIAGEKVIQVKLGSDVLYVNGSPIQMDAKAELKDGRAYVPMKFIAVALGVSSSWDAATKTATFSNVATK